VTKIPIHDATAPIVCTIGDHEIADRIELIERLRHHLRRVDRTERGMLLHFVNDVDVDADLRRFALDEKRCCQFWGFAIESVNDELTLRWEGPPDADALIDRVLAYLRGDQPLSSIDGLL